MKTRLIRYSLVILITFIIVIIFVNFIFNGLHDQGAAGLIFGLIFSQFVITPIFLKTRWFVRVIATLINAFVPVIIIKLVSRGLIEIGMVQADIICFLLYFIFIIVLFELELLINKFFIKDIGAIKKV